MAAASEQQPTHSHAYLLALPRLAAKTQVLYYPAEPSWNFLAAATQERITVGITGMPIQAPEIDAVWQNSPTGGIRRWEQVDFPNGKRLVRIFEGVADIGSFGDGRLAEAHLYRLVDEGERKVWKGQAINTDGSLGTAYYPYAGIPLAAYADLLDTQRARDTETRRLRAEQEQA